MSIIVTNENFISDSLGQHLFYTLNNSSEFVTSLGSREYEYESEHTLKTNRPSKWNPIDCNVFSGTDGRNVAILLSDLSGAVCANFF